MANYTYANLTATIPQKWADIVNEAKFPQFVLQDFVTDLSEYASEDGRIIHVPNLYTNVFTASTQTPGADIYSSAQAVAQVDLTISIDTHRYVAWVIGDLEMAQIAKKYSLNREYAMEATKVLRQALEDALFALYASLTTTTIGTGAAAIDDLSVRQAIRTLAAANFELDECAFFFHPNVYFDQLIGLSKISPNYASNMNVMTTGTLGDPNNLQMRSSGKLYGQPVFISSRVPTVTTTVKNLFLNKRAFGFGTQGGSSKGVRFQMENNLRLLGVLAVADIRYGVGILRSDAGVVLNMLTLGTVA